MNKRFLILWTCVIIVFICCAKQAKTVSEINISKEEALRIAEEVCQQENWDWVDVRITDNKDYWDVMTNSSHLGMNGWIRIDKRTGKVIEKEMTGP